MRAKVTYFSNRKSAYVSGSKLAVLAQVNKLLDRGYRLRDNSKMSNGTEGASCWLIR